MRTEGLTPELPPGNISTWQTHRGGQASDPKETRTAFYPKSHPAETALTLNQSLSDPHSGVSTFTHFSSTQLSACHGPGPLKGPRGGTSNKGSETRTGKHEPSPVPGRGAQTRQGSSPRQPSHALACNWHFTFIVLHPFSPSVTPRSRRNPVYGSPAGRATSKGAWSPRAHGPQGLGEGALTPVRKAARGRSTPWAHSPKHSDQKRNWGAERMREGWRQRCW